MKAPASFGVAAGVTTAFVLSQIGLLNAGSLIGCWLAFAYYETRETCR